MIVLQPVLFNTVYYIECVYSKYLYVHLIKITSTTTISLNHRAKNLLTKVSNHETVIHIWKDSKLHGRDFTTGKPLSNLYRKHKALRSVYYKATVKTAVHRPFLLNKVPNISDSTIKRVYTNEQTNYDIFYAERAPSMTLFYIRLETVRRTGTQKMYEKREALEQRPSTKEESETV